MPPFSVLLKTVGLLILSNVFMTLAWYGHLRYGGTEKNSLTLKVMAMAILASWAVAFFEYCLQVPANRIGYAGGFSAGQLKIIQEVITLGVFVPFSLFVLKEKWNWNYLWAALCVMGAVFFVFRSRDS